MVKKSTAKFDELLKTWRELCASGRVVNKWRDSFMDFYNWATANHYACGDKIVLKNINGWYGDHNCFIEHRVPEKHIKFKEKFGVPFLVFKRELKNGLSPKEIVRKYGRAKYTLDGVSRYEDEWAKLANLALTELRRRLVVNDGVFEHFLLEEQEIYEGILWIKRLNVIKNLIKRAKERKRGN